MKTTTKTAITIILVNLLTVACGTGFLPDNAPTGEECEGGVTAFYHLAEHSTTSYNLGDRTIQEARVGSLHTATCGSELNFRGWLINVVHREELAREVDNPFDASGLICRDREAWLVNFRHRIPNGGEGEDIDCADFDQVKLRDGSGTIVLDNADLEISQPGDRVHSQILVDIRQEEENDSDVCGSGNAEATLDLIFVPILEDADGNPVKAVPISEITHRVIIN